MSLFTRVNTLLASGSLWEILVSSDKELAERRPFNSLLVQNRSYSPVEVRVNNRLFGTVGGQAYATFSGLAELELDVLSIKNIGISSIPASKVTLYLTNGSTSVDISGLGTEIAGDIDIPVTVTPTATALATDTAAHRFAKYFELSVSSIGSLTPGTHKVYHGSGPYRELLNVGSYYNYEQAGKVYDLSTLKVKCDSPYPGPELGLYGDCETAKPTLSGGSLDYFSTSALSTTYKHAGTKSLKVSATGGGTVWGYLYGDTSLVTFAPMTKNRPYKMGVWCYVPTGQNVNYWQISLQALCNNATVLSSSTVPLAFDSWQYLYVDLLIGNSATYLYFQVLANAGVAAGSSFYLDDFSVAQSNFGTADYPVVNLSGGY